jgi:nuclear GTP-binding protein
VETVLKGVVRAERLQNPTDFVAPILSRVTKEHVQRHYGLKEWTDDVDFMTQLARQKGKLLKGGEPDLDTIAKSMIYDWQRVRGAARCGRIIAVTLLSPLRACEQGKLPYFVPPPRSSKDDKAGDAAGEALEDGAGSDDDEEEEEEDEEVRCVHSLLRVDSG